MLCRLFTLTAIFPFLCFNGHKSFAIEIYFSDGGIHRSISNGTDIVEINLGASGLHTSQGLAIDQTNGMIYASAHSSGIFRADLGGENSEEVLGGPFSENPVVDDPHPIALDIDDGKIYWGEGLKGQILRSDLDGVNPEVLVNSAGSDEINGLALDLVNRKMYWNDSTIHRADLDGNNVEDLPINSADPRAIALDVQSEKIYWSNTFLNRIQRANLDGTDVEDIITGRDSPTSLALDLNNRNLYWLEDSPDYTTLLRADLEGNNIEQLVRRRHEFENFYGAVALDFSTPNFVIQGAGETYTQNFDDMAIETDGRNSLPTGWTSFINERRTKDFGSLGLEENPAIGLTSAIVNVGGNAERFGSSDP